MTTLEELEGKIKANPYAREFYQLALEYQKIGKFTEAKSVLLKGLERNQGNFQARLLLAKILIAENNFAEAKKQIERVLLIVPDNISANHLAAEISEALGDKEAALKYYKVVELFEPDRDGIKEKIAELEGDKQKTKEQTEEEEKTEEERFEIPSEEEKEKQISEIKYEEEKEEPRTEKEISENIIEEKEKEEETPAEEPIKEVEEQPLLSEEKNEEDLYKHTESEPFQQLEEEHEDKEMLKGEEETSSEIGEDTLTNLLEDSSSLEEEQKEEALKEEELKENIEEEEKSSNSNGQILVEEEPDYQEQQEEKEEVSSLSTATLAELYEKQGYPDKAIEIYQHILLKEPEREDIRNRIQKLKREMLGMETQDDVGVVDVKSALRGKRIEALKLWLKKIREADNV